MGRTGALGVAFLVAASAGLFGGLLQLPLLVGLSFVGPTATFVGTVLAGEVGIAVVTYAFLQTGDAGDLRTVWARPDARGLALVVVGTAVAIASNRIAFAAGAAVGIDPVASVSPPTELANWTTMAALVPVFVLVVGPVEEYCFRGVLQRYLGRTFSTRGAIGWASVLFVLLHVPAVLQVDPRAFLVTGPLLFGVSLLLGWSYEYAGTLVVPALVHGLYNVAVFWLALSAFGL